jgi:ADP-ribosylglycohydrolase
MRTNILDAVYGCLVGSAISEALGAPVEGMHYREIREQYGKLTEFIPSYRGNTGNRYEASRGEAGVPGAVTDDATWRHYIALTIARKGGRITPDDFAALLIEKMNPDRLWLNERIVYQKLLIGMNPWDMGRGTVPASCAMMAIAPVGIINAGNPTQAYQDALDIAGVNQDEVNRDAAGTLAAAVATALLPGATVEDVLAAADKHSSFVIRRTLVLALDLARASADVDEFAAKFYARMLDWTAPSPPWKGAWDKNYYESGNSLEVLPAVMGILYLTGGDVNRCIIEGANFGRDCDTIGNVVGGLAGCLQGASAIRPDWIETVETVNAGLFQEVEGDPSANFYKMAKRLVESLKAEQLATRERADRLAQLLETNLAGGTLYL